MTRSPAKRSAVSPSEEDEDDVEDRAGAEVSALPSSANQTSDGPSRSSGSSSSAAFMLSARRFRQMSKRMVMTKKT